MKTFISSCGSRKLRLSNKSFRGAGKVVVGRTIHSISAPALDTNALGFCDYMRICGVTRADILRILGPRGRTFYWEYDAVHREKKVVDAQAKP